MKNNEFYKGEVFDTISLPESVINCLPDFALSYKNNIQVPNFCAFENDYRGFTYVGCTKYSNYTDGFFSIGITFNCARCKRYITIENDFSPRHPQLEPLLYDYSFINVKSPFSEDEIKEIKKFSKDFLSIYDQTLTAENMHLDNIVVGGYRKALEILVKDYLFNYKKFEKTADTSLGNCIKDHMKEFDEGTIKMASLAVKIGNDGTHWKSDLNFNVEYMKKLINMFCHDILNNITKDEASAIFDKLEQDKKK